MAALSKHGTEVARLTDPRKDWKPVLSFRSDGSILRKDRTHTRWGILCGRKNGFAGSVNDVAATVETYRNSGWVEASQ